MPAGKPYPSCAEILKEDGRVGERKDYISQKQE